MQLFSMKIMKGSRIVWIATNAVSETCCMECPDNFIKGFRYFCRIAFKHVRNFVYSCITSPGYLNLILQILEDINPFTAVYKCMQYARGSTAILILLWCYI